MGVMSASYGLGAVDNSEAMALEANARILVKEAQIKRKLTKPEKLKVVAQVQRENGLRRTFDSPQRYDPKMPGYAKDFELIDYSQTPGEQVAAAGRNTLKYGAGYVKDVARTADERLRQITDKAGKATGVLPWLVLAGVVAFGLGKGLR